MSCGTRSTDDAEYFAKLRKIETEWEQMEIAYTLLKAKLNRHLDKRPCDYVITDGKRYWIQRRHTDGSRAGFGYADLPVTHKAVYRMKRQSEADTYAKYLSEHYPNQTFGVENVDRRQEKSDSPKH